MNTQIDNRPGLDLDNMPVALVQLDTKRRITAMNATAEALFGISRQAGEGRRLSDILYHDCMLFDLVDRAEHSHGHTSSPALQLQGPSIKSRNDYHASVSRTGDGGYALALSLNTASGGSDIDTEALAAFARILGHEVKNPLAGVSGAAQLLKREARDDQKELLDLILAESERISRLADKLSAFELFSSPRSLPCNVHQILEQVIRSEEAAFGKGVRFERNFDPSLPDIHADADHLHEAFQNIIRNAGEAVRDYGSGDYVKISTRFSLEHYNMKTADNGAGRSIKVSISDNGPGIDKKNQKKIFEMFQTSKPNGSGLGLTVAGQVINAHGGQISLNSQTGNTVFNIFLPIAKVN